MEMVRRRPIKVNRKPIKLPQHLKMQIKLWEVMEETREDDIYELSKHYDMLVMEVTHRAGHNSLSLKNPTEHKNWVHFERVYEICRMKGWDPKLYIEAQFERAKTWNWSQMKYPQPNALYSEKALRFFTNYLSSIKQKYEHDTRKEEKERGRETKLLRTKIVDDIVASVETLSKYIERTKHEDKAQYKALRIFQSWAELSPYYLWSVPWFHEVLNELDGALVEKYRAEFDTIRKSPMIQRIIRETVPQVEQFYNVPGNIQL
jgi:hypothetical protein